MLQLTTATAKKALIAGFNARRALAREKQKGEEVMASVIRTTEVVGSAFLLGGIQGAGVFKDGELFHVPIELAAGLGLHGLRLLGFGGKHADHLAAFGDGALASYANILGRGVGAQHWGSGSATRGSMDGDLADRLSAISNTV